MERDEPPPAAQTERLATPPEPPAEDEAGNKSLLARFCGMFRRSGPETTKGLEQEIQDLLEEGEEQGLISAHEEQLITSIFDFRETRASEIMTPSAEIVAAESGIPVQELMQLIVKEGYTRIPIYKDTLDHVLGVVHAKDLLQSCVCGKGTGKTIDALLKPVSFVAESKPITELLREFQSNKTHMAMVTDEFGDVRGLITLEDVLEEIVGEIDDEYDTEDSGLKVVDERTVIVDAKVDVEDVEQHFGLELPEGPYESIGGFVVHRLGRVPETGASLQEGSLAFKVLSADARRAKSLRISKEA